MTHAGEGGTELVVAERFRLDPPLGDDPAAQIDSEDGVHVELDDGRRVRLAAGDERSIAFARVIGGASELGRPVAFEIDEGGAVVRLHLPHVSPVRAVAPDVGGDLRVDLLASHARHVLRRTHPDFDRFAEQLRAAAGSGREAIVTENDLHEILDVRLGEGGGGPPVALEPKPSIIERLKAIIARLRALCILGAVSSTRAQELFDDLAARTCDPATVPPPCIPFLYPDDGCWGRAHEMARLLVAEGLTPAKVWIQGSLHVDTANNPSCAVTWGWHVAPTICVRRRGCLGQLRTQRMVIDPALFSTPVTKATWKSVQGDANAVLSDTSWTIFHKWGSATPGGMFSKLDPTFTGTDLVLATYRLALQNRVASYGPPPYPCP